MRKWAKNSVESVISQFDAKVSYVVIDERGIDTDASKHYFQYLNSIREHGSWSLCLSIEKFLVKPWYMQSTNINQIDWLEDAQFLYCSPVKTDGIREKLPTDVISEIDNSDIILRFGFGILSGDILEAGSNGIWSYHHGKIAEYRGRPAGVWEHLNEEPQAGITLQELTNTLDGGKIISEESVNIEDKSDWIDVRSKLFRQSPSILKSAVSSVTSDDYNPSPPDRLGRNYTPPGVLTSFLLASESVWSRYGPV